MSRLYGSHGFPEQAQESGASRRLGEFFSDQVMTLRSRSGEVHSRVRVPGTAVRAAQASRWPHVCPHVQHVSKQLWGPASQPPSWASVSSLVLVPEVPSGMSGLQQEGVVQGKGESWGCHPRAHGPEEELLCPFQAEASGHQKALCWPWNFSHCRLVPWGQGQASHFSLVCLRPGLHLGEPRVSAQLLP